MSLSNNQSTLSIPQNTSFMNSKNSSYIDNNLSQMSMDAKTYKFKVILLGDSAVGKTSICNQFINHEFTPNYHCTVTAEFKVKTLSLDKSTMVEIKLWDTCGQEKFRSMTRNYYNDTNGVFIIFDLTNRKTFDNISGWIEDLREYADSNCEIIIVGNKSDLVEKIVVSPDEIKKFSNTYKLNYIEVSAKHGTNIVLLFETLINQMVAKQKVKDSVREGADRMYVNRQNLYQEDHKEKVGCC